MALAKRDCDIRVPAQYSTIQAGVDAAVAGDTVYVSPGTYEEDLIISKSLRLSGSGVRKPSIINPSGSFRTVFIDAQNVIVEGFVINGVGSDRWEAALVINELAAHATVRSNRIVASDGADALQAYGDQDDDLIQNNVIEGNNSPEIAIVDGTPCCGKPSDDVRFLNNTFRGTLQQPSYWPDSGFVLASEATNNVIEGNAFDATGTITRTIALSYSSAVIGDNNFNTNPIVVSAGYDGGTVNAENNWWGDLDPSDNVLGPVDFTPWATKPFPQTQS